MATPVTRPNRLKGTSWGNKPTPFDETSWDLLLRSDSPLFYDCLFLLLTYPFIDPFLLRPSSFSLHILIRRKKKWVVVVSLLVDDNNTFH